MDRIRAYEVGEDQGAWGFGGAHLSPSLSPYPPHSLSPLSLFLVLCVGVCVYVEQERARGSARFLCGEPGPTNFKVSLILFRYSI